MIKSLLDTKKNAVKEVLNDIAERKDEISKLQFTTAHIF